MRISYHRTRESFVDKVLKIIFRSKRVELREVQRKFNNKKLLPSNIKIIQRRFMKCVWHADLVEPTKNAYKV
jgi:asparagine synthetase A